MQRLHRSRTNRVILGVCGGLAEYFRIDAILLRIICILVAMSGVGFFAYLVAALIMPEDRGSQDKEQWRSSSGSGAAYNSGANPGSPDTGGTEWNGTGAGAGSYEGTDTGSGFESGFGKDEGWDRPPKYNSEKNKFVFGAILVGLGVLILVKQFMPVLFNLKFLVPVLLIGVGGIIVYRGRK